MIEIERVSKSYAGRRVVDDLSLKVGEGELCVLIGPSGCGKSTTLKMINRLIETEGGTIRVGGEDISRLDPEILRRRIGYVIQSVGLFPHWTVAQNIATLPRLKRWPRARIDARIAELLALFRLDPAIDAGKYPHQLSGGEQQRVGVARALAGDPELLLMDEPFAAVDPPTRLQLQEELLRIHRATGKTILFVTHDLDEALRLANRIALMDRGRLVQWGAPIDLLERPAADFVRDFVGRQALGLKLLAVRRVAERVRFGESAEGRPVALEAPLSQALAAMAEAGSDRLPVSDGEGRILGAICLADLVA